MLLFCIPSLKNVCIKASLERYVKAYRRALDGLERDSLVPKVTVCVGRGPTSVEGRRPMISYLTS
jgi:hypothetical protein